MFQTETYVADIYEKHAVTLIGKPLIDVPLVVQGQTPSIHPTAKHFFHMCLDYFAGIK